MTKPWWKSWRGAVVGLAVVLAMVGVVLFSLNAKGGTPTAGPSPEPTPTATAPATASPSASIPLAEETATMGVDQVAAYCSDYKTILGSGTTSNSDDDAGVDFDKLAALYEDLLGKYQAASKNAPASLADQYAKVIQFLKDAKAVAETKDINAVRAQFSLLSSLNEAMEAIEKASQKLCK